MKLLPLYCVLFLAMGCTTLDKIGRPAIEPVTESNYKDLGGMYKDYNGTWPNLWEMVAPYKSMLHKGETWRNPSRDSAFIRILPRNKNKIVLELFDQRGTIRTKVVRGKIKEGYFYGRQHYVIYPLPPIFFGYDFYKYRIGFSNGNLIVDERRNKWWLFFLIHGGKDGYKTTKTFRRR